MRTTKIYVREPHSNAGVGRKERGSVVEVVGDVVVVGGVLVVVVVLEQLELVLTLQQLQLLLELLLQQQQLSVAQVDGLLRIWHVSRVHTSRVHVSRVHTSCFI